MKQKLFAAAAAILIFILGFQVGRLSVKPEGTTGLQDATQEMAEYVDDEAETSAECNGTALADGHTPILDYKGDTLAVAELNGPKKLVARFSTTACRPCLNALTASLQSFARTHPDWEIVLLIKRVGLRDLYVMSRDFGPQFILLACDSLPIDFDNGDTPVLFRTARDGTVRDHFTCRYGDYARTDSYLRQLADNGD